MSEIDLEEWERDTYKHKFPIDPISYIFEKLVVHSDILKKRPQCEGCDFMQFESFTPWAYYKCVVKDHCSSCPNFKDTVKEDENNKE